MNHSQPQLIKTKTLLVTVGIIAFSLPFVLILFDFLLAKDFIVHQALSDYYHSKSSVAFVGALCAVGMIFFAYKGYSLEGSKPTFTPWWDPFKTWSDGNISTLIACCAISVAVFPTSDKINTPPASVPEWVVLAHFVVAAIFFILLSYMALVRFTRISADDIRATRMKKNRNQLYKTCGWAMIILILLMAVNFLVDQFTDLGGISHFTLIGEALSLVAFGIAWAVKGELWMGDK